MQIIGALELQRHGARALAVVAALCVVLGACGDDDSAATNPDAGTLDAAQDAAAGRDAMVDASRDGADDDDAGDALDLTLPAHLAAAFAAARDGGESDLDGDGDADLITVIGTDEVTTRVIVDGHEILVVVRRTDGSADKTGDYNLDGTPDYIEHEQESATQLTRAVEQDSDFDGVVDTRESYSDDTLALQSHYRREVLLDGSFVTDVDRTTDSADYFDAIAGCDAIVPPRGSDDVEELEVVGEITIAACVPGDQNGCNSANPRGACSPTETARLRAAFALLFRDELDELAALSDVNINDTAVMQCLRKRKPHFLEALTRRLTRGPGPRISCGIQCAPGSEGNLRGLSHASDRTLVSVNTRDPNDSLVTTLLHELIHSAGYPGPDDHNDVNGAKNDDIYKCSQWCTGRSIRSRDASGDLVYDPNGDLDLDDCVKCSGTKAAREECCNGKQACTDGCCDVACAADGTCPGGDPCNPTTNGLDFSKCAFDGVTELVGGCSTSVTWIFDRFAGSKVYLQPIMGNTDCTSGLQNPDCAVAPMTHAIAPADGELALDYTTTPPTYQGYGTTRWTITFSCPDTASQMIPFLSNWFAQAQPTSFTGGQTITDHVVVEDGELNFAFSYRR